MNKQTAIQKIKNLIDTAQRRMIAAHDIDDTYDANAERVARDYLQCALAYVEDIDDDEEKTS